MSAIATLLAEMGHPVSGHDPSDDTPVPRPARARWASPSTIGAAGTAAAGRRGRRRPRPPRPTTPTSWRRSGAGMPVRAPVRGARGDLRRPAHDRRGRRHPRQDHHLRAARHGAGGGRCRRRAGSSAPRSPASAAARRGAATGRSSSRPTRATARSSPSARGERSSPTSSPTTSSTGAGRRELRAAFERFVAAPGRSGGPLRRRPGRRRAGRARAPTRHLRHRRRRATTGSTDVATEGTGVRLRPRARRRPGRRRGAGRPGRAQRPQRGRRARRWRTTLGVDLADGRRRPGSASGAWPAASRSAARPPGSCSSTATTTCPPRSRPRWRRPAPGAGGGWCAASSPTATAAPRRSGGPSPTASPTPTCSSSPASTPPARRPGPGSPGKIVVDAVLDAHPWKHVAWLPDPRRRRRPTSAACSAPATSASPSAPATSPRSRPGAARGSRGAAR